MKLHKLLQIMLLCKGSGMVVPKLKTCIKTSLCALWIICRSVACL